jgi:hypothetical protein
MTITSSLLKTLLHKTIADGLFKEVQSRNSRYYYFLGKTIKWEDENAPPFPTDSYKYEKATRNEIITLKEIKPSDVAFVIPRIDWVSGTVYDIYDDQYSTEVIGINITDGGNTYTATPTIVIDPPDLFGGVQATAIPIMYSSKVVGATMTHTGSGYTNPPAITFVGGGNDADTAHAVGVLSKAPSNSQKLEDSRFYVMTDEFNVYKCLNNNNGAFSINKPIGTQVAPIALADGYIWKYMYNVPIALRTKFLTADQIPVITALTQQFYSAGGIESVIIQNRGTGYTQATLTVAGDGYLEDDPVYLSALTYTNKGHDYADGDTISIAKPMDTAASWNSNTAYYFGVKIISSENNIYEVIQAGTTGNVEPTHKTGTVGNGTAALKFIGSVPRAYPSFNAGAITVNVLGGIREINLNSFGSGYTTNPVVSFTSPTKTFAGTAVNTISEVITIGAHWFRTGDKVQYSNGGGTTITGLVNNTTYYIIKSSSTAVKLASTYQNAIDGTAVNITSAGVGSSHSLSNQLDLPTAVADLSPTGVVKRIIITDPGNNYTTPPTVTIGNPWAVSTAVTLGQQYFVSNRLYTVTTAGTTHASTAPSGTGLGIEETNGTAGLTYVGSAASGEAVLRYGAGYDGNPSITINTTTGSGFSASFTSIKSEAKLIPLIENGQINGVQIDNAGIGYSAATITVTGDGMDASLTADIAIGNINTLQANNELLTVDGSINNIQVISQGYAYGTASVIIEGDGTGATASAVLSGGKVIKINMTNYGSGYTYANITIVGNGYAASARAIISPFGGHGKDAYEELFARTLMFYSNVSLDKNQGFDVNNDYRQVGIIKNIRGYGVTTRYDSALGSACFVVEGSFDTAHFVADMIITTPRTVNDTVYYRQYRIVSVNASGTGMLVQMLDNDPPQIADVMTNSLNQFFSVTAVGNPTVDKYSGDCLFIDNKAGFTPSKDETVTLRTVIKF